MPLRTAGMSRPMRVPPQGGSATVPVLARVAAAAPGPGAGVAQWDDPDAAQAAVAPSLVSLSSSCSTQPAIGY